MKKLVAIGEALIDFLPSESDKSIKDVPSFIPKVGGAPLNVLGAYATLGGETEMITMLGTDPFGEKIISEMDKYNIGKTFLKRTEKANTALAFVSLGNDGSREFSFYRNPSADLLLDESDIDENCLKDTFALHFCSVSLVDHPIKRAHRKIIQMAHDENVLVSFDPNIRLPLWTDHEKLRETVREFIPKADIIKIADDELDFILKEREIKSLFEGRVKIIIITKGKNGAELLTKTEHVIASPLPELNTIDTTGAGDCFIGSFLWKLSHYNTIPKDLEKLDISTLKTCLDFANERAGKSTTKLGAISSYLTI